MSGSPSSFRLATIKEGKSVCIFDDNKAYMQELRNVLDRDEIRDLPVCPVAVAGEYRTGKSFLLSYLLRYLYAIQQGDKNLLGDEAEALIGFDHKCDDNPVTQGIKIWNQPLIIENKTEDGTPKKMVVILMDSQGIFCAKDAEEATQTFSLTTMISSMLIFNLMSQLNDSIIEHLQLFTAYAGMTASADKNTHKIPFQKLMLLIRDWKKPSKKPFGSEGGKQYFDEYFEPMPKTADRREWLRSTFKELACYLMPSPGECIEDEDFKGNHKVLRTAFKEHLSKLGEYLFNPSHLANNLKEVNGEIITAGKFCKYFEQCSILMTSANWKKPQNMLKMNASYESELAKEEAMKCYKSSMESNIRDISVMTKDQLDAITGTAEAKAKNMFEEQSAFTRKHEEEIYNEYSQKLTKDLEDNCKNYEKQWKDAVKIKEADDEKQKLIAENIKKEEDLEASRKREKDANDAKVKAEEDANDAKRKAEADSEASRKREKDANDAKVKAEADANDAKVKAEADANKAKRKAEEDSEALEASRKREKDANDAKVKAEAAAQDAINKSNQGGGVGEIVGEMVGSFFGTLLRPMVAAARNQIG